MGSRTAHNRRDEKGEFVGKITAEDCREIISRYKRGDYLIDIGKAFGISRQAVWQIVNGITHVEKTGISYARRSSE